MPPQTSSAIPLLIRPSYVLGGQNMNIAFGGRGRPRVHGNHPAARDRQTLFSSTSTSWASRSKTDAICDGEEILDSRHYGAH